MGRPFGSKNSYRVTRPSGAAAYRWNGGRRLSKAGYVMIFVGGEKHYVFEHILVVEAALGHSLPEGAVVHHHNERKDDNRGVNLVACQDDAYHVELHRKMKVRRAGGDPWLHRLCCSCKKPKLSREFHGQRSKETAFNPTGRGSMCIACKRERRQHTEVAA